MRHVLWGLVVALVGCQTDGGWEPHALVCQEWQETELEVDQAGRLGVRPVDVYNAVAVGTVSVALTGGRLAGGLPDRTSWDRIATPNASVRPAEYPGDASCEPQLNLPMVIEWRAPDLGMSLSSDADLLLYDNEFTTTALSLRAPELVFEPESVLAQVVTQDGIALSDLSVYWNGGWSNGTLEVVGPALVQNASADPSDVLVEFTMTSISPD